MKFKFLSIIMAFAIALAFTACDEKKASASDASETSESTEQVEKEVKAPTGDAAADARQAAEEMIALMTKDIKSVADAENIETEMAEIQKKYEDFYKEKGEDALKKFNEELEKLENDPDIKKKVEDAQKVMMENAEKLVGEKMEQSAE